jgi:hypothetical protein
VKSDHAGRERSQACLELYASVFGQPVIVVDSLTLAVPFRLGESSLAYWPVARDRCLSRFGRLLLFQNDFLRLLIVSPTKKGRLPQLVVSSEFCVFDFTD